MIWNLLIPAAKIMIEPSNSCYAWERAFFIFILLLFSTISINAQNIRLHNDTKILKEQYVSSDSDFHLTIKPYTPGDFIKFDSLKKVEVSSKIANHLLNRDLLNFEDNNFKFKANPIIDSKIIYDLDESSLYSGYKLGLNLEASYKSKLFFSTDIFISRMNYPSFQSKYADSLGIISHYGTFISKTNDYYLYSSFTGELTYKASEHFYFHVGRGKNFLGNGYRSLFLSDNSNAYPYLKVTADIWKIKYIWMAAKLKDIQLLNPNFEAVLYDKAAFIHYLSLNLTKRINFNFFESIISNPYDQEGRKKGYEFAYFNPVIFFRPVEFYTGTSDNSLMGMGLNLRLWKSVYLYSQFILDDLIISKINDGSGWWGNKFGLQTGLKSYHLFNIQGFFFRGEVNIVRPYTYSHGEINTYEGVANLNYGNYFQELAHPTGANFIESLAEIRYQTGRFFTNAELVIAKKGTDTDTVNYGSDIYLSYNLRPNDYGIRFLQGSAGNFIYAEFGASYMINPKYELMLETAIQYRSIKTQSNHRKNLIFNLGISTKIFNENYDYF